MIAPKPVLAEWVPLHGRMGRKPTAASWRRRGLIGDVYDLVLLTVYGVELVHTGDPTANLPWLSTPEFTHWLEGHPEDTPT